MKNRNFINFVGRSGSGKTTVIEKIIPRLKGAGYRVAVIKSMRHAFDIDHPGKDSFRYREAGGEAVAITNGKTCGAIIESDLGPLEIAERFFYDADLVIVEGYKEGPLAKIEVIGDSAEPPLFESGTEGIKMVITERAVETSLPVVSRDDIEGILETIKGVFNL